MLILFLFACFNSKEDIADAIVKPSLPDMCQEISSGHISIYRCTIPEDNRQCLIFRSIYSMAQDCKDIPIESRQSY